MVYNVGYGTATTYATRHFEHDHHESSYHSQQETQSHVLFAMLGFFTGERDRKSRTIIFSADTQCASNGDLVPIQCSHRSDFPVDPKQFVSECGDVNTSG